MFSNQKVSNIPNPRSIAGATILPANAPIAVPIGPPSAVPIAAPKVVLIPNDPTVLRSLPLLLSKKIGIPFNLVYIIFSHFIYIGTFSYFVYPFPKIFGSG